MNVLAIGNSFSEDSTKYLHSIAKADGKNVTVVNLYLPACSLERHYRNMLSGKDAYELQYNGNKTGFYVSLTEALLNRKWDVITIQQVSHQSFNADTYEPYITELVAYFRKCSPKSKIYLHETWAYEEGSDRLLNMAKYPTSASMLADIVKANADIAEKINAYGIIPSGELFGKLSASGITQIHRDTYHATLGLGRYALALLWYHILCGKSVAENEFCDLDLPITDEERRIVKECVDSM